MILEALREKQKRIARKASFIEGRRSSLLDKVLDLDKKISGLEKDISKLDKVRIILSKMVDNLVKKDLGQIDSLVTYGLRTVFPDRDIVFKTNMKEVAGKMQVNFTTLDNGRPISEDAYGSVSVVESLILRMICMSKMDIGKMLLLDETFSAVGDKYIDRIGVLLKELADKMGLDILLVSFNPGASEANILRAKLTKGNELTIIPEGKNAKTN